VVRKYGGDFMRVQCLKIVLVLAAFLLTATPLKAFAEKRNFEMTIDTVKIKVNDQLTYTVFGFNGQVPGPLIHVKEGDEVVTLSNSKRYSVKSVSLWTGFGIVDTKELTIVSQD